MQIKRVLISGLAGAWGPLLLWVGGQDITQRGEPLAISLALFTICFLFMYICPYWHDNK